MGALPLFLACEGQRTLLVVGGLWNEALMPFLVHELGVD